MSTAKKRTWYSPEARNGAFAAINIKWLQMRPDLRFEDRNTVRDERLAWVAAFLGLPKLASLTDLTSDQIGIVLDEMNRLSGGRPTNYAAKPVQRDVKPSAKVVNIADYRQPNQPEAADAQITHLSGEAQIFTINKLVAAIGWSDEHFREFLFSKFRRRSPRMLTFKQCNSLTMILLNIAADKDLRAQGKTKISRAMTAKYIPILKRKLDINQ